MGTKCCYDRECHFLLLLPILGQNPTLRNLRPQAIKRAAFHMCLCRSVQHDTEFSTALCLPHMYRGFAPRNAVSHSPCTPRCHLAVSDNTPCCLRYPYYRGKKKEIASWNWTYNSQHILNHRKLHFAFRIYTTCTKAAISKHVLSKSAFLCICSEPLL